MIGTTRPVLTVPAVYGAAFKAALQGGRDIARNSPTTPVDQLARKAVRTPPGPVTTEYELRMLHQVAASRTADGVAAAVWHAEHGASTLWTPWIREYIDRVGDKRAAGGLALLDAVRATVPGLRRDLKSHFQRPRPYEIDPTLPLAVPAVPGRNHSFPSGHTSDATAMAVALAALMPDRRPYLEHAAAEVGWSRIYGGVHFPSDTIAGARMAAAVTTALIAARAGTFAVATDSRSAA